MQYDNGEACASCERPFGQHDDGGAPVRRFGNSAFCISCINECAGAVTRDHCCMVCMDVVM